MNTVSNGQALREAGHRAKKTECENFMGTYSVKTPHQIFFNFLLGPRFKERELKVESRPLTLTSFYVKKNPIFSGRKNLKN